ncbi:MAG: RHS repeat domain-containing protein [Terriglobales bacterium]
MTFGSTDSDAFSFDSNTGRMTQYQFNVNGQSIAGALTWNANGSLGSLAITDPYNTTNNQACTYAHDDLSRITSTNCGVAWSQTFSYAPFGNISKAGSSSFQPTYNAANNRISQLPGFTPTYDANGNLTADSIHTYSWDAEGRPVSIDSVGLTYDALGRMVEQNRSGVYTQIVYDPTGGKLALMTGQTLQKAFVPLPGGNAAVYTSSGLSRYRLVDWLGSARFASTPARGMYFDTAYAPYGEPYAQAGTTDLSFTGQNQDSVTGLYDFLFREQHPTQGRWVSPDPAGLEAADPSNPQSINRYAYVADSPLDRVDPLGLFYIERGCGEDEPPGFDPPFDFPPIPGVPGIPGGGGGGVGGAAAFSEEDGFWKRVLKNEAIKQLLAKIRGLLKKKVPKPFIVPYAVCECWLNWGTPVFCDYDCLCETKDGKGGKHWRDQGFKMETIQKACAGWTTCPDYVKTVTLMPFGEDWPGKPAIIECGAW